MGVFYWIYASGHTTQEKLGEEQQGGWYLIGAIRWFGGGLVGGNVIRNEGGKHPGET